jgi:hypothetical protein
MGEAPTSVYILQFNALKTRLASNTDALDHDSASFYLEATTLESRLQT